MTKLKKSLNCDYTKKQNKIVTKQNKKSNCDWTKKTQIVNKLKLKIVTKLKNQIVTKQNIMVTKLKETQLN